MPQSRCCTQPGGAEQPKRWTPGRLWSWERRRARSPARRRRIRPRRPSPDRQRPRNPVVYDASTMTRFSVDPAVAALIVTCLALLFAAAALHKLRDLRSFAQVFTAYEILPAIVRLRLTGLVPVLEAAVAAGV